MSRQILGKILGLGLGLTKICVSISPYMAMIYGNEKLVWYVRDAEVARSNRVAPIL